ncbi:ribosomal maturation YjgA family protein [Sediminibacterium soli]|uniref:ribosomal maturation YjgA family protein n=1 Tax=Sediminibacterium soli TaxID=2698829 RepID=UPI001379C6CD|nr:DUF2809 domain-containing protein [Sediminibacterium soli]NCI45521.1 DUF2809 domain-containing protein [Sediminibacterium soli]
MLRFHKTYGLLALVLFVVEVLIATYIHDAIIRPYVGDVLVVILIYCFVRCFTSFGIVATATGSLLFAFLIETLQYLRIVERLGLAGSRIANIVIGNSFAWMDMAAYMAGTILVLVTERIVRKKDRYVKNNPYGID